MKRYNPSEIEPKWQQIWEDQKVNEVVADLGKQKIYVSGMFPYPSGAGMHTGHAFSYSIVDAIARFHRQHGRNVLNPMGWDTFGLPAENYAIKTGTAPAVVTAQNIANFKKQFKRMGVSIDWSREINTSDPEYYRWTQWIFTKLFERGLAYQKESLQWWCPVDKTVLANEQVEGGHCWRCGSEVEKKSMKQWFFKITDYAESLLNEIPDLDWPQKIKTAQTNWIGKSQGAEIEFKIDSDPQTNFLLLHGFTGRADKNFIPWLKQELEKTGAKVQSPQLPNTDQPTEEEQVGYVLDNCSIDEHTVIVGHSLGGAVAMKVIEKLDHKIAGLVLVAPAVEPAFRRVQDERSFWHTFDFNYEYDAIKNKTGYRIVLSDKLEAEKRESYLVYLADKLNAAFYQTNAEKNHFTATEEPFILSHLSSFITVFSTRPDTIFGATFVVLAPEHPLAKQLATDDMRESVETYITNAVKKSEIERMNDTREKTGVFTGSYATNPASGEQVPIWIADYVLSGYGTGAIMAVPAHDERDFAFAEKFDLPIIQVVEKPAEESDAGIYHGEGLLVNSGRFDGVSSSDAREEIVAWLEQQGTGHSQITYKMRDWLISRQRYWGAPIPIIHCDEHGAVAVPENQLPVVLPVIDDYAPKGDGLSALARADDWVNTTCPTCGKPAKRETDTLDGYACSSWYLLRYGDPKNSERAWDPDTINYWNPLDYYVGGDHAVAHLLYVRFWTHVFNEMGLTSFKEPVKKLIYHGYINAEDGRKMSKSLGNVIDPLDVIDQGYGADALRTYVLFMGPIELDAAWSSKGIAGIYRFLNRVWVLTQEYIQSEKSFTGNDKAVRRIQHKTIRRVTDDFNRLSFNTAISALMECTNELYKLKVDGFSDKVWGEALSTLIQLLSPFAPHMSEEINCELGSDILVQNTPWPVWDDALIVEENITIIVQVNGKLRAKLEVAKDTDEASIKNLALEDANVRVFVGDKKPTKVIYVPGRLVNIVVTT
jgi:leucyl-tRNA synthetase